MDVTSENIDQFSIEDVVCPMVGHNIRLPKNDDLRKIIEDIMAEDGITMASIA